LFENNDQATQKIIQTVTFETGKFLLQKLIILLIWRKPQMDIKNLDESLAPLNDMKSFLIVHEDEKLVIKKLEQELLELKKLVDDLYYNKVKHINENIK
jgi:hypothetical protein